MTLIILYRRIKRKLINFTNYFNNRRLIHLAVLFLHLPSFSVTQSCFLLSQSGSSTSKKKPQGTLVKLSRRFIDIVWRTSFEDVTRDHSRNLDLCREHPLDHRSRRGTAVLSLSSWEEHPKRNAKDCLLAARQIDWGFNTAMRRNGS